MGRENDRRWIWEKTRIPLLLLVLAVTAMDMLTTPTDWRFIVFGQFLFNAIPAVLFFSLILAISRNPRFSTVITWLLCAIVYLTNYMIYYQWNSYLLPAHFYLAIADIRVTGLIFTNLSFPLFVSGIMIVGAVLGTGLAVFALSNNRKPEILFPPRIRAAMVLAVSVMALTMHYGKDGVAAVMRGVAIEQHEWDMGEQIKRGLFNHLYLTATNPGLFTRMIKGDPSNILELAERLPPLDCDDYCVRPDVVAVLAESMIDPLTLRADFHADPLAGLRAGTAKNRASGLIRVHIAGGRTWNSEYTFLTGIPGPLFSWSAPRPFILADSNTWTIARAFRKLGYKTIAVYAARGNYIFNARAKYLDLGFDQFLDDKDIDARYGKADGTADGMVLNAIDQILRDEPEPTFIFAVSYDLHMPYANKRNGLFVDESVGTPAVQEYFRRQNEFSTKVSKFIEDQDKKGDPMLFAMFGDHVPPLLRDFEEIGFRDDVPDPLYKTPYLLHSTYGPVSVNPPNLDLSYLAGLVFDQARLDSGQYFRVNSMFRGLCGGAFIRCSAAPELIQSYYAYLYTNIAAGAKVGY